MEMYEREIKAREVGPYWPKNTCGCLIVFSVCIMLQMSGKSSRWSARSEYQRQPSCPLSSSAHNEMCNSVLHLNKSERRESNCQGALRIHRTSPSAWHVGQLCCGRWLTEEPDWCLERRLTDETLGVFFTWDKLAFLLAATCEPYVPLSKKILTITMS